MKDAEILLKLSEIYKGTDNYKRPKSEYFEKVLGMNADDFSREIRNKIWLSAYASNNPRSDYHWQVDGLYDICSMRGTPEIYKEAYRHVYISQFGVDPYPES